MPISTLHQRAIIIDGHSDILNLLADGRMRLCEHPNVPPADQFPAALFARQANWATPYQLSPYTSWYQCMGQYDIPSFQAGSLTCQIMAIYVDDSYCATALDRALTMVACFHREIADNPDTLLLATSAADIRRAKAEGKTALMLSFEGAEPLGHNLALLDVFYQLGLRMASLTHSRRNAMADGTQMHVTVGGLTDLGRACVRRMNELGIIIDLAHLADPGIWDVLELSSAPVVYTHINFRQGIEGYRTGLCSINPHYGRSKLQAIAATGGVAGVIFWGQPDIASIIDEIDAAIQHVGDLHIALGSDFYGFEQAPHGLEDMGKLPALTEALLQRGYSDTTIERILGGNLLRVIEQVCG